VAGIKILPLFFIVDIYDDVKNSENTLCENLIFSSKMRLGHDRLCSVAESAIFQLLRL